MVFLQQENAQEGCDKYLPFILHGDGGAFQRSDSIIVLGMRSLLSASSVALSQLLLVAIPKSAVHKSDIPGQDTMNCLWSILTWSLSHMFFGKFPERGHLEHEWSSKTPRAKKAGAKLVIVVWSLPSCWWWVFSDGEFFQNAAGHVVPTNLISPTLTSAREHCGGIPWRTSRSTAPQTTWSPLSQASMATALPTTLCTSWNLVWHHT